MSKKAKNKIHDNLEFFEKNLQNISSTVDPVLNQNINSNEKKYPKYVIFIILNVFFERLSLYGCWSILYIFLSEFLKESKDSATVIYHILSLFCYFTPFFGPLLAGNLNKKN